jgi:hypothetical protein
MRFTDNQDGTITDTETGLMWQQETMEKKDWDNAILSCSELNLAGHKDWRLPTIEELLSIVDFERHDPACDPVFKAQSGYYRSSSTDGPTGAWLVYFYIGGAFAGTKTGGYYVRAVRARSMVEQHASERGKAVALREEIGRADEFDGSETVVSKTMYDSMANLAIARETLIAALQAENARLVDNEGFIKGINAALLPYQKRALDAEAELAAVEGHLREANYSEEAMAEERDALREELRLANASLTAAKADVEAVSK